MYPLFESVCILNGEIQNGSYHESRFKNSYFKHFKKDPDYLLFDSINLPQLVTSIKYKLRIDYNLKGTSWTISEYQNKIPSTLKVVNDDSITYDLKYNDRNHLNKLFQQRETADDVLIITNGKISDASYSNILFTDGVQIETPASPLLKGTCRARLLSENKIKEAIITLDDLNRFQSFQLINALNDFNESRWIEIKNIVI